MIKITLGIAIGFITEFLNYSEASKRYLIGLQSTFIWCITQTNLELFTRYQ